DDRTFEPVARLEDEVELERRVRRAGPHASPYERRATGSADSEVARGVVVLELEPVDAATIADRVDLAVGLIVRKARALAVLPFDARAFDRTAFLIRDSTRDGASRCLDPPQRGAELARVGARIELRAHVGAHETFLRDLHLRRLCATDVLDARLASFVGVDAVVRIEGAIHTGVRRSDADPGERATFLVGDASDDRRPGIEGE